jgi:hypothetical protein
MSQNWGDVEAAVAAEQRAIDLLTQRIHEATLEHLPAAPAVPKPKTEN